MSEKDEALQHLNGIKSILDDKKFFPYNYNALISWGVISIVLSLFLPMLLKNSLVYGSFFLILLVGAGFFVEGFLIKKENINYDIDDCTRRQKFIFRIYFFTSLFGITMSILLAKYQLLIPIFMLWMFICGLGNVVVGHTINKKLFSIAGYFSISLAVLLIFISIFISDLGSVESWFFRISQLATIISIGIVPIYLASVIKKQEANSV